MGSIDGLQGTWLTGWACRQSALDQRLWLEVRVNNIPLTVCRAEHFHLEAHERNLGDGCYGFWLQLPEAVLSTGGDVSLYVANTDEPVGLPVALDDLPDTQAHLGAVYFDGGLRVSGWLRDAEDSHAVLTVRGMLDGKVLARALAQERRPHPPESDGHGFSLTLPLELADGQPHEIDVVDDQGRHLPGSPVRVLDVLEGGSQWLASLKKPRQEQIDLTTALLARYENWFPKAAGLNMYAEWAAAFTDKPPRRQSPSQVGVILLPGEESTAARQSLMRQHDTRWIAWQPKGSPKDSAPGDPRFLSFDADRPFTEATARALRRLQQDCDWIVLLASECVLEPQALGHLMAAAFDSSAELIYTDGIRIDSKHEGADGDLTLRFKPAWDMDLFFGYDYLDGPLLCRAELLEVVREPLWRLLAAQTNRDAVEAAHEMRIHLALHAAKRPGGIRHLPVPLYCQTAGADDRAAEPSRAAALQRWCDQQETGVRVTLQPSEAQPDLAVIRLHWPLTRKPLVSLIIPTRDRLDLLQPCLESLQAHTTYSPLELIVVDNNSRKAATLDYFEQLQDQGVRILRYAHPFNYSAINNLAVAAAQGEVVGLLNNDLELITPDWLEEMLALLLRPEVGVVGAKLLWPNNLVQHGGVVTGIHQLAAHVGNTWLADEPGYLQRNLLVGRWHAVTAACLLTRRSDYLNCGGLDAVNFPVTFNDVDYCLKLGQQGKITLWTPHARFYHHESASRGKADTPAKEALAQREMQRLRDKWGDILLNDPCYNPNLSLSTYTGVFEGLALPPRKRSLR